MRLTIFCVERGIRRNRHIQEPLLILRTTRNSACSVTTIIEDIATGTKMVAPSGRLAVLFVPLLLLPLLQTTIASHLLTGHDVPQRVLTTYEITMNRLFAEGVEPRRFDLEIGDVRNDPLISDSFSQRYHDGRELVSGRKANMGAIVPSLSSGPSMSDVNGSFYRWDSVVPPAVVDWRLTPRITPIFSQFQVSASSLHRLSGCLRRTLPQCSGP